MIKTSSISDHPDSVPNAVAIGVFDGVHRGHQALLRTMISAAQARELHTTVITFHPHPKVLLRGLTGRLYLNTVEERVHLLKGLGIDQVIVLPFNDAIRNKRAAEFVEEMCTALKMRQLWSGDFGIGYQREGTATFLRKMGESHDFSVHEYGTKQHANGSAISSSRIRSSLAEGNIEDVTLCLGRSYKLTGQVIEGDRRGRTIGFPTANMDVWPEQLVPGNGVYAGTVVVDGVRYAAATNIGIRPTVGGDIHRIEPHLLDFSGDIYGKTITLELVTRIRAEMKFNGLDQLKSQIASDVAEVRAIIL